MQPRVCKPNITEVWTRQLSNHFCHLCVANSAVVTCIDVCNSTHRCGWKLEEAAALKTHCTRYSTLQGCCRAWTDANCTYYVATGYSVCTLVHIALVCADMNPFRQTKPALAKAAAQSRRADRGCTAGDLV